MVTNERRLARGIIVEKYRFIALATTKWHVLGAEACFIKYGKPGCKGLMILHEHPTAGLLVESGEVNAELFDVETVGSGVRSFAADAAKACWALRLSFFTPKETTWIASPTAVGGFLSLVLRWSGSSNYRYVRIDEGIGTYLTSDEEWESILKKETGRGTGRVASRAKSADSNKLGSQVGSFLLLDSDGSPDYENAGFYSDALRRRGRVDDGVVFSEKTVLLCTGPYCEDESISRNDYESILKSFSAICRDCGFDVCVKPHPREVVSVRIYEDLNFTVLPRNLSFEEILASGETLPLAIAGFSSTALISSALLFGVPSVCVDTVYGVWGFSDKHCLFAERFRSFTSGYVNSPRSLKELSSFLLSVLNGRSSLSNG